MLKKLLTDLVLQSQWTERIKTDASKLEILSFLPSVYITRMPTVIWVCYASGAGNVVCVMW